MPTQIYSSSDGWIKQAEEQIENYPSGMIKTTQVYIYPGITSYFPSALNNAYPEPVLEYTSEGFTRAVGYLYSIKIILEETVDESAGTSPNTGEYVSPKKIKSKNVKTGNATKITARKVRVKEENQIIYVNKLFTETFSFEYLTDQIGTEGASKTASLTPSPPSGIPAITVLKSPSGFSPSDVYDKKWVLTSYGSQNYGEVYETKFVYEGSAKMYKFIDLTGDNYPPPPAP